MITPKKSCKFPTIAMIIIFFLVMTQSQAQASYYAYDTTYGYVDYYGNMHLTLDCVFYINGQYFDLSWYYSSYQIVPGILIPEYVDCQCTSYSSQAYTGGYYWYWWANSGVYSFEWDFYARNGYFNSCSGSVCRSCSPPATGTPYLYYSYYGSTYINVYFTC